MITKVIGKSNGFNVIFNHKGGDTWEVAVPSNKDGEYVVEVYAYNDIGRWAYVCRMLFTISGHSLQIRMIDSRFSAEANKDQLSAHIDFNKFMANIEHNYMKTDDKKIIYSSQLKVGGGYKIERVICRSDKC